MYCVRDGSWRRRFLAPALSLVIWSGALSGCLTTRPSVPPPRPPPAWEQRVGTLQRADTWQMDGRAAVAVGKQGWQANLNWLQMPAAAEVQLAGPLGIGAVVLRRTAAGLSINGAPPSDTVVLQLQERLGFELPLDTLRFWLLGAPDPSLAFDATRNAQDRLLHLVQAGWAIDYDRYLTVAGDLLPARLVLSRDDVRLRIAVDHWEWHP